VSVFGGPNLVTDGLVLCLDAGNTRSYPGSGTTWTDLTPNAANITLVNSPTHTAGVNGYFTFASASSQRGTGSASNVIPTTAYTKSVWFYLNTIADNNLLSSDTGGHFMWFNSTSTMYNGHTDWASYTSYGSTATFSTSTWYHVSLTFNTTDGFVLYINGIIDSTYTAQKTAHTGTGATNVGSFATGNLLNGRIASAMCYNRSLTSAEVLQNFNALRGRFGI